MNERTKKYTVVYRIGTCDKVFIKHLKAKDEESAVKYITDCYPNADIFKVLEEESKSL